MKRFLFVLWATALTLAPGVAFAAQAQKLDTGNTAWILTSTALVLFMTLPASRCSTAASYARKMFSRC